MSQFPECLKPRGAYGLPAKVDEDGPNYAEMNGQACHRIAFHDGGCLFDRPPEFDPPRMEARPLPKPRGLRLLTPEKGFGWSWKERP